MYKLLFAGLLVSFLIAIALSAMQKKECSEFEENDELLKRPQNPKQSQSYVEQEVSFENNDADVILSGTLTLPKLKEKSPIVILISGYGKHDRDVTTMGGHKYFQVLSDYLIQQGIGVLRFDKRGVGKSTGNFDTANTQDFAQDVLAGVEYLKSRKDSNVSQIGLIGLSEGGLIASLVAAESKDISYSVLMAPAVQESVDDLIQQTGFQLQADGATKEFITNDRKLRKKIYATIMQESDYANAEKELQEIVADYLMNLPESQKVEASNLAFAFTESKKDMLIKTFNSPWYHFFLRLDRAAALEKITIPVLVINGNLDWIASPHKVFPVISQALEKASNKDYRMIELPNLNHMFQTAKTGALAEYAAIEEAISPLALDTITTWILEKTSKK